MAKTTQKKNCKYVAYVSTYTMSGDNHGIKIYDVDMENGRLIEKNQVQITNSSYVTISHNSKYLYSITDMGVEGYRIDQKTGDLTTINQAPINGMRGCYLSSDYHDKFLIVAGYHDGKMTVLKLNEDGSIGGIADEIFHHGLGNIAERNFRPHISCVKPTRDNKYLLAADQGTDHVYVYAFDNVTGKVKLSDIIHCDIESEPHHLKFTKDGKFLYIVHQQKTIIDVYSYEEKNGSPEFEKIQTVPTLNEYHAGGSAACALNFSSDDNLLISSNAGDNSVVVFRVDHKTGMLSRLMCLPVSGDYPKDANFFPDMKSIVSLNHESNTMTFFRFDVEKGTLIMNGKELKIDKPNCIIFHELQG